MSWGEKQITFWTEVLFLFVEKILTEVRGLELSDHLKPTSRSQDLLAVTRDMLFGGCEFAVHSSDMVSVAIFQRSSFVRMMAFMISNSPRCR